MIAKLTGLFDSSGTDWLVIDVGGVGYQVFASGRTLSQLPAMGQKISLMIEPLVRNEQTHLFGFLLASERTWFRLLLSVQGVGGKVALALLSALSPDELSQAILTQDRTLVTRAEGVGPKLAGRIVAELKDKVGGMDVSLTETSNPSPALFGGMSEAISALANLGYRRSEAVEAIAKASQTLGVGASVEALIRQGLAHLSQSLGASHG
jgi:Holliday junction DNA helicase RuvA